MTGLSIGSADRKRDAAAAQRPQQDGRQHHGVAVVRVAEAFLEERRGRENQLQVRQRPIPAGCGTNPYASPTFEVSMPRLRTR